jgi:hypothetical protein
MKKNPTVAARGPAPAHVAHKNLKLEGKKRKKGNKIIIRRKKGCI